MKRYPGPHSVGTNIHLLTRLSMKIVSLGLWFFISEISLSNKTWGNRFVTFFSCQPLLLTGVSAMSLVMDVENGVCPAAFFSSPTKHSYSKKECLVSFSFSQSFCMLIGNKNKIILAVQF